MVFNRLKITHPHLRRLCQPDRARRHRRRRRVLGDRRARSANRRMTALGGNLRYVGTALQNEELYRAHPAARPRLSRADELKPPVPRHNAGSGPRRALTQAKAKIAVGRTRDAIDQRARQSWTHRPSRPTIVRTRPPDGRRARACCSAGGDALTAATAKCSRSAKHPTAPTTTPRRPSVNAASCWSGWPNWRFLATQDAGWHRRRSKERAPRRSTRSTPCEKFRILEPPAAAGSRQR